MSGFARPAAAQAAAQDQQKPSYTIPEYNAFQAANAEKDPAAKIKLLDDFVSKFPNSTLLQYVYQLYFQTYFQMKNYPKTIEYADKLVAMGDKVDPAVVLGALQTRVQAFSAMQFNPSAPDANDQLTKERDAALARREAARGVSQAGDGAKCRTRILRSRRSPESRSSTLPLAPPRFS